MIPNIFKKIPGSIKSSCHLDTLSDSSSFVTVYLGFYHSLTRQKHLRNLTLSFNDFPLSSRLNAVSFVKLTIESRTFTPLPF